MRPLKPIVLLGLAAAVVFAVYSIFFPPAEKVIAKRLNGLAAAISANPGGNIAKVANVSKIGGYFHPNVRISLQGFGPEVSSISGRGELEQIALGARQSLGRIEVRFYNIDIKVAESGTEAAVRMTALVSIDRQADPAVRNVALAMEKVDRKWLIREASPAADPAP